MRKKIRKEKAVDQAVEARNYDSGLEGRKATGSEGFPSRRMTGSRRGVATKSSGSSRVVVVAWSNPG